MSDIKMTSGFGQFHTNEPDPNKPDKKLTPYASITLAEIQALIDKPQQVNKNRAQWLIPSTLSTRSFKNQEAHGTFYLLWVDFDESPPPLFKIKEHIKSVLAGSDYEIYNTRSATAKNKKARLLIPLQNPLSGADWILAQQTLNDILESLNIKPDRAAERPAQLCYLPNKGEYYKSSSQRDGVLFNPLETWTNVIKAKRDKLESERIALNKAKERALEKRKLLSLTNA